MKSESKTVDQKNDDLAGPTARRHGLARLDIAPIQDRRFQRAVFWFSLR
jgi:hypothetical protein